MTDGRELTKIEVRGVKLVGDNSRGPDMGTDSVKMMKSTRF